MKAFSIAVLAMTLLGAPALAQSAPDPGDGTPPALAQARQRARDTAMAALTAEHQGRVNDILTQVKSGHISDPRDAAQQIDAVLSPAEAKAIIAARDTMLSDMREMGMRGGPPQTVADGPPRDGGPDGAGPPPGEIRPASRRGRRGDAGFALLVLNLDRDQMRALFSSAGPPAR